MQWKLCGGTFICNYISLFSFLLPKDSNALQRSSDTLQCPSESEQIGEHNADVAGCGLENCDDRFYNDRDTLEKCRDHCKKNERWEIS